MAAKSGRAWTMERASVSTDKGSRSNKYAGGDQDKEPGPGERSRIWVGGYTRKDGTKVQGYYRSPPRSD